MATEKATEKRKESNGNPTSPTPVMPVTTLPPVEPAAAEPATSRLPSAKASPKRPTITLLTDFGTTDYFVGAIKGVVLSANPEARVVDITHEIPSCDVETAAFTLLASYQSFPEGTFHVAIVDPGVGSDRRALLVEAAGQSFIGPDNGIFSYVYEREPDHKVFEITNSEFFGHPISSTFHGRDIFAPVAAALSNGVNPTELGKEITNFLRLSPLAPELKDGKLKARVIHIDRFGNCVTSLTRDFLPESGQIALRINGKKVHSIKRFYAEPTEDKEKLFAIWGSAGFLEIAAENKSAAKMLRAKRGDKIMLSTKEKSTKETKKQEEREEKTAKVNSKSTAA
jgi:S-adenosyl-L-methionine hydrolase (adenosine-forming)